MTSRPGTVLWGRQREQAVIEQVLRDLRAGRSRALVLGGETGIGKTALLQDMLARADGVAAVRLSDVQSEGELAYGALHALWSQLSEEGVGRLPAPQRRALRIIFGLEAGPAPNKLLSGGNAQWSRGSGRAAAAVGGHRRRAMAPDRASAQTLAFVARRLQAEGVGLVFAVRELMSWRVCSSCRSPDSAPRMLAGCSHQRCRSRSNRSSLSGSLPKAIGIRSHFWSSLTAWPARI